MLVLVLVLSVAALTYSQNTSLLLNVTETSVSVNTTGVVKIVQNFSDVEKPALKEDKVQVAGIFDFNFGYKKAIGDSCDSTDDCKIKEAFCIDGTCQCSSEYVPSSNKKSCLLKSKSLMNNCVENIQCEEGMNAHDLVACISFRCICALDAHLVNGKCYKKLILGNACQVDEECHIPFSACIKNVCACTENMEPDEDNSECKHIGYIDPRNTTCTYDYTCSKFGDLYRCDNGVCRCKPGLRFSSGSCVEEKKIGDTCQQSSDCLVGFEVRERSGLRECKNNVCTCIKGYKGDKNHNLCRNGSSNISFSLLQLALIVLFYTCTK